jgi:hypothetical protein
MLTISHPFDLRLIQDSLTEFVGYGGMTMKTVGASFGVVPVEDVLSGKAPAIEVTATSDGHGYIPEWDTSNKDFDSYDLVYVERYSTRGREFHGWIDRESRKIVQSG